MVHYYYYEKQNENMNSITSYLKKKIIQNIKF